MNNEELELVNALVAEFPDNDVALVLKGNVLRRQGDVTEGIKSWQKALKINPKRADVYAAIAAMALRKGNYDESLDIYEKALQIKPRMPGVHLEMAKALMAQGQFEQGIAQLQTEMTISPPSATLHTVLAQAHLQQKEYEKARGHYEAAVKLKPNSPNPYYGLFRISLTLGDRARTEQYMALFKKYQAAEMDHLTEMSQTSDELAAIRAAVADTFLHAARFHLSQRNRQKSEQLLIRATSIDPTHIATLSSLAMVYSQTGHLLNALGAYARIAELAPDDPVAHLNRGKLETHLRRFSHAERSFRSAIEVAPENSGGYRELALLYIRSPSKLSQARELARKAVALKPNAENYFALSRSCEKLGDSESALTAIRKAIQLSPENLKYQKVYERVKPKN